MPSFETPQEVLDYRRVERALTWLDTQGGRRPQMTELAASLGMSPSHLSRLFARWAGVPPKRFLSYLTKEHAKALLGAGATTLGAAAALGLSSQSRLHDLLIHADAVSPGEHREAGEGVLLRWGVAGSPFGLCFVAVSNRGVFSMSFVDGPDVEAECGAVHRELPRARLARDDGAAREVIARAFVPPAAADAPLALWLRGTPFQLKVWEAVLGLSPGAVASYGDVARGIGHEGAARAVGGALAANRLAVLVPCHRVIRSVGETSAYRWGRQRKRLLLARESAEAGSRERGPELRVSR